MASNNFDGGPISVLPGSAAYTPDYQALLQNDPAFQALQQHISAQGIQDAAQRQAATEQALVGYGQVPDFASVAQQLGLSPDALAMLQADTDPNTAALANANTHAGLSTTAQLAQQQQMAMLGLRNSLAARGALSSGDDAYRTNLQDQAYAKAQQAALSSLLGAIGGYQQQYLNEHNTEQDQLDQGLRTALTFESGLPQNQPFTLTYNAKTGTYTDPTGNTYSVQANGTGGWTLTNSGTGTAYTLGANGNLSPYTPPPTPTPAPAPAVSTPHDFVAPGGGHHSTTLPAPAPVTGRGFQPDARSPLNAQMGQPIPQPPRPVLLGPPVHAPQPGRPLPTPAI